MNFDWADFWDDLWRDNHGKVVIWQWPSIPLYVWALCTAISLIVNKGSTADVFYWVGEIALIGWAILEIWKGVNYFRKALGVVIIIFAVLSLIHNI
jgi:hypothetical protein